MIDRLTGQDLWMLAPDEVGWPQDIGAVGILDGTCFPGGDGTILLDAVRAHIDARLHLAPRLRQVVYRPGRGLGRPLWVDARRFDVADHVKAVTLEPPGDEAQLVRFCEQLRRRPLDRSRPPWELWLLPGLADGRIGVYVRLHHAIADGVAGVATIGALLDPNSDAPPLTPPRWAPEPIPSREELRADVLRRRRRAAGRAIASLRHPLRTIRAARRLWSQLRAPFAEEQSSPTSLNRPVGRDRRLALVRSRLAPMRHVAHDHQGKVNDAVLAAVAGATRALLRSRDEPVDGLKLRATVPVSLHHGVAAEAANLSAMMAVQLPVGEPDPIRRLELIAAETAIRKQHARSNPFTPLMGMHCFQRVGMRVWARQRLVNVYVTNVPGPARLLYLAGMPLLEVFPVAPLGGNITVGVGVLSYAGQLNVTVVSDRDRCPDIEVFAAALRRDLDAMTSSVDTADTRHPVPA